MIIQRLYRSLIAIIALMILAACTSDAVKKEPDYEGAALINARLGLAYMQQDNYELALEKLEKAKKQDPNQAVTYHYLAELYRQLNAPEEAEKHYKKALKLLPGDFSLHNNYGVFLCEQKKFDEAKNSFLMAVQTIPAHLSRHEYYENLAQCLTRKPDWVMAEKYFRIALSINPRLPLTLFQMARISFQNEKYLRARAFFQRFSELSTHTPETLWLGVLIERKLGDKKAVAKFARQLKVNFPLAEETLTLMESE